MFSLASLPPSPRHKHTHTKWEDQGEQEEQHSSSTSPLTRFPKSQHKKTGVSFTTVEQQPNTFCWGENALSSHSEHWDTTATPARLIC